ncbi:MAG: Rieske 2Fe-2S domain-containing protein [Thermoleophilia bacterium]|nr:Rieske 2Fe-2S domain-containing protein [Thermoleophilia bacterium]
MKSADVPAMQGVAGKIGDRKVAVYNSGDALVVLENICTHMGCQTDWNPEEQLWECPCHGSRYNSDGSVVRGPAMNPLTPLPFRLDDGEIVLD